MIGTGVPRGLVSEVEATIAERLAAADGGAAAPPRSNGELVFEAPWESRSFGMAVALSEARYAAIGRLFGGA